MRLLTECPLRVETRDGEPTKISGYASVFYRPGEAGTQFDAGGGFVERVLPGAFEVALRAQSDILSLWNHKSDYPLGRRGNGTLQLSVDQRGLHYSVTPPDTQWARDLLVSIQRGDVRGSSIGFSVAPGGESRRLEGSTRVREIRLFAALLDVSPVTMPAFTATTAEIRSSEEQAWLALEATETGSLARLARIREIEMRAKGLHRERRGRALASLLETTIADRLGDDGDRAELLERIASAAGIEVSTLNQILSGEINCPPPDRLRGFRDVLGLSIERMRSAMESDGCP